MKRKAHFRVLTFCQGFPQEIKVKTILIYKQVLQIRKYSILILRKLKIVFDRQLKEGFRGFVKVCFPCDLWNF